MAIVQNTICDFCGKIKGETNHWWTVLLRPAVLSGKPEIAIFERTGGGKDACGHQCVTQAVARFLDHGSLEER